MKQKRGGSKSGSRCILMREKDPICGIVAQVKSRLHNIEQKKCKTHHSCRYDTNYNSKIFQMSWVRIMRVALKTNW